MVAKLEHPTKARLESKKDRLCIIINQVDRVRIFERTSKKRRNHKGSNGFPDILPATAFTKKEVGEQVCIQYELCSRDCLATQRPLSVASDDRPLVADSTRSAMLPVSGH